MRLWVFVALIAVAMLSFAGVVILFLKEKKKLAWILLIFNILMIAFGLLTLFLVLWNR